MAPSLGHTTVLFVDDDDFIRGAYADLLRDEGFSVVEAADGCEALKAAAEISGDVLLVLDEEMPRLRGSEMLAQLDCRADSARFRVVVISGSAAEHLLSVPRLTLRIHAVVEKPFDAAELLDTLHRLAA